MSIRTTAQLQADGYCRNEVARLVAREELRRVRRGAYADASDRSPSAEAQHRQLVIATLPLAAADAVVSHRSAAVLHGLPLLSPPPERVDVTRERARGGKNRGRIHLHATRLTKPEVTVVDGIRVTSLARTVVDLARTLPFDAAVVTGDAALRMDLESEQLQATLMLALRRPGSAAARRVVNFLDDRSESVGESLSRVGMHRDGITKPDLQMPIRDTLGNVVARTDFGWEEYKTVGEFDGRIKYGRLLRPGESMQDVIWREKRREDALRDLGWQEVRWLWEDLYRPGVVAARLRRAFARSGTSVPE